MPLKSGRLTPQEQVFVGAYAETGVAAYAGKRAAYKSNGAAAAVLARPAVQAAIRERELAIIHNDLLPLANQVLRTALTSDSVPWGAKIKAVDLVHKRAFSEQEGGSGKAPSEMTPDELGQALDKLKRELSERATPVLDLEPEQEDIPKQGVFD